MDEEMINMLRSRQEEGMALLRTNYGGLIRYIAGGILQSPEDTEECVSDICMLVWEKIGSYSAERGSVSAWLTALSRNAAINFLKRRRPHEELFDDYKGADSPEYELLRKEQAQRLKDVINLLDTRQRNLFFRKYYYLQSTARIAAELGTTERAVEGRLYRLRKKLQKALGGDLS
ncbi:MAG: RNA polymerase sigma factor [Oscillospiraceae bacterium]